MHPKGCDLLIISLYHLELICEWVESVADALLELGFWHTSRSVVAVDAIPFRYRTIYFK